ELEKIRRAFNDVVFRPFHDLMVAVESADEARPKNDRLAPRVNRALHYLRRSYLESDPIDRFEDVAAALQSLDPLLRRKFGLPTAYDPKCSCGQILTCKHCGAVTARP